MKQSSKDRVHSMDMAGHIVEGEDGQFYIKTSNLKGNPFKWKPQGYFNAKLKKFSDFKGKVLVKIHIHLLEEDELCELVSAKVQRS